MRSPPGREGRARPWRPQGSPAGTQSSVLRQGLGRACSSDASLPGGCVAGNKPALLRLEYCVAMLATRGRERPMADTATTMRDPRARFAALLAAVTWLVALPAHAAPAPPPLGDSAPNFALTTQQYDRLWLTQLRGRAVVLAFGCTGCGACPGLLERLVEVARGLGDAPGQRVFFALVTVD